MKIILDDPDVMRYLESVPILRSHSQQTSLIGFLRALNDESQPAYVELNDGHIKAIVH